MGLDQYLRIIGRNGQTLTLWDPRSAPAENVEVMVLTPEGVEWEKRPAGKPTNTWRKWYELHEYMGDDKDLGAADLDALEAWFRQRDTDYDNEAVCDDMEESPEVYYRQHNKMLLKVARKALEGGFRVAYVHWA